MYRFINPNKSQPVLIINNQPFRKVLINDKTRAPVLGGHAEPKENLLIVHYREFVEGTSILIFLDGKTLKNRSQTARKNITRKIPTKLF